MMKWQSTERKYKCFSCGEWGHIAMNCPANALYYDDAETEDAFGSEAGEEVTHHGTVDGVLVRS